MTTSTTPKFTVQLKIRKPVAEVFEAVVDPKQLSSYFVKTSSGRLVEGDTVKWVFAEVPDSPCDVIVRSVRKDERLVLEWDAEDGPYRTTIEMTFHPLDGGHTMVKVTESGWRPTDEGIKASYGNCGGWMHMLVCLKGHLEYAINLRAGGAF